MATFQVQFKIGTKKSKCISNEYPSEPLTVPHFPQNLKIGFINRYVLYRYYFATLCATLCVVGKQSDLGVRYNYAYQYNNFLLTA